MAKDDLKLSSAKRSYRQASSVENRQEEARWGNVIGDILKNRGEYLEALKWLRIGYELSMKYLPEKQLLPTCQSLSEIYLCLQDYRQAKVYQQKHSTAIARGKPDERKCLLQQIKCLDTLIENSSRIFSWNNHLKFAKKKKIIARDLGDEEMLSDSLLVIGESYHKLRNFQKALKWYRKSWDTCKSIRNLEINTGDVLDSQGDWTSALEETAAQNSRSEKASNANHEEENPLSECSETDTEGYDCPSNGYNSPEFSECASTRSKSLNTTEDDVPLSSLLRPRKTLSKQKVGQVERPFVTLTESPPKIMSNSTDKQKMFGGRKRIRLVISDDESDGVAESEYSREKCHIPDENLATSYDSRKNDGESEFVNGVQASFRRIASKDIHSVSTSINHEASNCSYKLGSPKVVGVDDASHFATSGSKADGGHISDNLLQKRNPADFSDDNLWHNIPFRIDEKVIHLDAFSCMVGEMLSIERIKSEVACLLPVIRHMTCGGKVLESLEPATLMDYIRGKGWIEVTIDLWVQKRLIKLYIDWCKKLSEAPSIKLLKKLYNLEVSEDEILGSECELQDISVAPLLNALNEHKAVTLLDLSHNLLEIFVSSSQKYGGLILDLHCNRFGPTALFQICECPVLFARLEMLNVSGNRLTDGCGEYLSTILGSCKALYSLNIERCSITSRTIQKVAGAISSGSVLSHLSIGRLCTDISLIGGILELNLGGNPIRQQGLDALVSLLMSPGCSLKDLVLNKCNLGLAGLLKYLKSLQAEVQSSDSNPNSCSLKEVEVTHQEKEDCTVNSEIELEVADSEEDLPTKGKPVLSVGFENSCTSSCQKNTSFQGSQLIEELSFSVASAKHLKLLVLSNNGFTTDVAETLYTAWSSSSGGGLAQRRIKDQTVHFSVEGKSCCGIEVCCKRD
ncbi:hypothetical protein MKX01_023115 [Papaver californicum]|nr:hypothetical protein MKX01_023115 [Papaver californicum]